MQMTQSSVGGDFQIETFSKKLYNCETFLICNVALELLTRRKREAVISLDADPSTLQHQNFILCYFSSLAISLMHISQP